MSKPVKTVAKTATLREAVKIMDENNIGVLAIVKEGKAKGVLTERDVLRRVVAKNLDLDKVTVEEIMTKNPVTIGSTTFTPPLLDLAGVSRPDPVGSNPDAGAYESDKAQGDFDIQLSH